MFSISIEYSNQVSEPDEEYGEGDGFIDDVKGDIYLTYQDCDDFYSKKDRELIASINETLILAHKEDGPDKVLIGNASWSYVYANDAARFGYSCMDICSVHSQDFSEIYWALHDEDHSPKDSVFEAIGQEIFYINDFATIDELSILPKFRRRGFGLEAIDIICRRIINGASIVVIQPAPLQFTRLGKDETYAQKMGYSDLEQDEKKATKKLFNYYKKVGFKRLKNTKYMLRGLD